jgi:hypothetical protein
MISIEGCNNKIVLNKYGKILEMFDNSIGKVINAGNDCGLPAFFTLNFVNKEYEETQSVSWQQSEFDVTSDEENIQFTHNSFYGAEVNILYSLEENLGLRLQMVVKNINAEIIDSLEFPRFTGFTLNESMASYAIAHGAGWKMAASDFNKNERIQINYPVFGSMQWVDYYTEDYGVYFGVHDDVPYTKIFEVGRYQDQLGIGVIFTDLNIKKGDVFRTPPIYIVPHKGDWHFGARIYRSWIKDKITKPHVPRWYTNNPSWSWVSMKEQYASNPKYLFSDLPALSKRVGDIGIKTIQISAYMEHGHDTRYPDYYAGKCMGGENELKKAVKEIHSNDLRITMYTNGRIVDPDSSLHNMSDWTNWCAQGMSLEHTKKIAQQHIGHPYKPLGATAWDPMGVCFKEHYGINVAVMCPDCKEWQDFFIQRLIYIAKEHNIDGIYIDQVCGCWSFACYSDNHNHKHPNEAWSGYKEFISRLRAALRKINPEIIISTEGVNDLIGQNFDIQQAHNDWKHGISNKAIHMPELFRYTLPWYILNMGPIGVDDYFYLRVAHLCGSGFDFILNSLGNASQEFIEEMSFALQVRTEYSDIFMEGNPIQGPLCNIKEYHTMAFRLKNSIIITGAWLSNHIKREETDQIIMDFSRMGLNKTHFNAMKIICPKGDAVIYKDAENLTITIDFEPIICCIIN